MSDTVLTNDEKRCLQMWFRHAIVQLERQEALTNIAAFYDDPDSKPRESHHAPVGSRPVRRPVGKAHKELV